MGKLGHNKLHGRESDFFHGIFVFCRMPKNKSKLGFSAVPTAKFQVGGLRVSSSCVQTAHHFGFVGNAGFSTSAKKASRSNRLNKR
jgi:hypothetical protein